MRYSLVHLMLFLRVSSILSLLADGEILKEKAHTLEVSLPLFLKRVHFNSFCRILILLGMFPVHWEDPFMIQLTAPKCGILLGGIY